MNKCLSKFYLFVLCVICTIPTNPLCAQLKPAEPYTLGPATPENDLIKLRYAFESSTSLKEKKKILKSIAQTGTFQGMMYAGKLMDDVQLCNAAASAFVDIAVSHSEYDGVLTRELLRKAQTYVSDACNKKIYEYFSQSQNENGFLSMFNGVDLTGWKGLVKNPIARSQMTLEELQSAQVKADEVMRNDWKVEDGMMAYVGHGYDNICTVEQYDDFEMYIDWMLDPSGKEPDAGIYLRGTPQVQIWDTARVNVGAQVGSGGLYNNKVNESKPTQVADNKVGIWNSFYIKMVGDKVTVKLNGVTVVDNVVLENYWDRKQPIFPIEQIELQAHGSKVYYRDMYIKRLKK